MRCAPYPGSWWLVDQLHGPVISVRAEAADKGGWGSEGLSPWTYSTSGHPAWSAGCRSFFPLALGADRKLPGPSGGRVGTSKSDSSPSTGQHVT